jgi:hypothetical protein
MAEFAASEIAKIDSMKMTAEGDLLVLKTKLPNNSEVIVGIPLHKIPSLIKFASAGRSGALKALNADLNKEEPYKTTRFELWGNPSKKTAVLSLTIEHGGRMDFALPERMPQAIYDALGVLLGKSIPVQEPGTRSN